MLTSRGNKMNVHRAYNLGHDKLDDIFDCSQDRRELKSLIPMRTLKHVHLHAHLGQACTLACPCLNIVNRDEDPGTPVLMTTLARRQAKSVEIAHA
eukprot:scaffold435_cov342-Pavlova_lutheri.AAC.11